MKVSFVKLTIIGFFACDLIYPVISFLSNTSFAKLFCNLLIITLLAITLVIDRKNIKIFPMVLFALCLGFFLLTAFLKPQYQSVIFDTYNMWENVFSPRKGLFLLLIFCIAKDPEDIFDALKISTILIWVAYTIRSLIGVGFTEFSRTNHAYGYAFLFVTIIYTICLFRNKNIIYFLIVGVSFFQVILYASRTAFLSYIVFLALYVLFYNNDKKNLEKKVFFIILGIAITFFVTSDLFLGFFSDITEKLGISSKIIDSIIMGENQLDGGRERTYDLAIRLLKENPWGLGAFWDRVYCEYGYVHSFLLEVLIDFGWILGSFIIVILVKNMVMILRSDDQKWKLLFIIFFSLSMVRLTLSYSFWFDTNFWAMVAVLICYRYHLIELEIAQKSLKEKKKF